MSATYMRMNVTDDSIDWDELNSVILYDPYTHFINKVLSEVMEQEHTDPPTFGEVHDVLFHGQIPDPDVTDVVFRFYAHALMIEHVVRDGIEYKTDERMIFEDGNCYDPRVFDWGRFGDLHTMISFVRPPRRKTFDVYCNVHLGDSDPNSSFDNLADALVEASRCAIIDGRAFTVVTPDGDNLTIEHT